MFYGDRYSVATKGKLQRIYKVREKIGSGTFSTVRRGVRRSDGEQIAIKMIRKTELNSLERRVIEREIGVMQRLLHRPRHRHIVALHDIFETVHHLYIVVEYCAGGELFDALLHSTPSGWFSERETADILRQIAEALAFMHRRNIVHRDLKLENLLISEKDPVTGTVTVKISDFGLSKQLRPFRASNEQSNGQSNGQLNGQSECKEDHDVDVEVDGNGMATHCGTLFYVAPEILRDDGYDEKVDLWSLGVIAYCLLSGSLPFYSENEVEVSELVLKGEYDLGERDAHWLTVSDSAKHLIRNLLMMDHTKRLSAEQVLSHRFVAPQKKPNHLQKRRSLKQLAIKWPLKQFRGMIHAAKQSLGAEPEQETECDLNDDDHAESKEMANAKTAD